MPFPMAPRRRPRIPSIEINGETDANRRISGAVAQLGERLLCKQEVGGSIPPGSTRESFRKKTNIVSFLNHSVVECDL